MSAGWRTLLLRIGDRCPEYGGSADHKEHIVSAPPTPQPAVYSLLAVGLKTLDYRSADLVVNVLV